MRKLKSLVVSAAALLLCLSASEAFAGLSVVGRGKSQSWSITFVVNSVGGIGNVTAPFNRIVISIAGATTYTVTSGTFSIGAPAAAGSLPPNSNNGTAGSIIEDLGSSGAHHAFGNLTNGWTQTSPSATGVGLTSAEISGQTILGAGNPGSQTFTVFFTGDEHTGVNATTDTHGAHFFVSFFNGSSLDTQYEIKDIIQGGTTGGTQGTEITQTFAALVPLPKSSWAGLAMLGGMGLFFVSRRRKRGALD
jgi:LPXTG-motif cell wall-anchored protein